MRLTLKTKISTAVLGVIGLGLLSTIVALLSAYQLKGVLRAVVTQNLESVIAAEELEIALLEQRGFVSAYLLAEGQTKWWTSFKANRRRLILGLPEPGLPLIRQISATCSRVYEMCTWNTEKNARRPLRSLIVARRAKQNASCWKMFSSFTNRHFNCARTSSRSMTNMCR